MKESIKNILLELLLFMIVFVLIIIYILCTGYDSPSQFKDEIISMFKDIEISLEEKANMEKDVEIAYIILGVTIISFVISFEMVNKEKAPKESSKEIEDLISPSIAEAVIDGKLEIKNLIMSTIIDLTTRGNIEIINNENIRLISKENLEPHELEIIDLIFQESTEIGFKDINIIFKNSNDKTFEFGKKIEKIKISIMDNLYKNKIFSNFKTFFNKAVTLIAIVSIINLMLLPVELDVAVKVQINMLLILAYITFSLKGVSILKEKNKKGGMFFYLIYFLAILFTIWSIAIKKFMMYKPQIFVISFLIIFLNILIIKNRKEIVLTNKGKKERIKLLKLKNYINEYSLIKDRDLSSTIVWDKYLAYATAFEIPNKVTDSIYESWYDLNITLQFIDKVL